MTEGSPLSLISLGAVHVGFQDLSLVWGSGGMSISGSRVLVTNLTSHTALVRVISFEGHLHCENVCGPL